MSRSENQTDETSHLVGGSRRPMPDTNQVTDETHIVKKAPLQNGEASATSTSRAQERSRNEYGSSSPHLSYRALGRRPRELDEPLPIYTVNDAGHDSLHNILALVLTFGHGGMVLDVESLHKVPESQRRVAANTKEADEIVPVLH